MQFPAIKSDAHGDFFSAVPARLGRHTILPPYGVVLPFGDRDTVIPKSLDIPYTALPVSK